MTTAVRNVLLILAVLLVSSLSYYFVVALPTHNRKLLEFEREKYQAEQAAKESARLNAEVSEQVREQMRDECSKVAESDYWDYIKLNGKAVPGKPGVWNAPMYIWE